MANPPLPEARRPSPSPEAEKLFERVRRAAEVCWCVAANADIGTSGLRLCSRCHALEAIDTFARAVAREQLLRAASDDEAAGSWGAWSEKLRLQMLRHIACFAPEYAFNASGVDEATIEAERRKVEAERARFIEDTMWRLARAWMKR